MMRVHLVNPSDSSFGIGVITPRWLYVLAAATPSEHGDPLVTDETLEQMRVEFLGAVEEVEKLYRKVQQGRQKLLAVQRGIKPKQHRSLRWELGRRHPRNLVS